MSTFDRLVVLDFEATCQEGEPPDPQEIIEFPSVLVSLSERAILAEHESFVRPLAHPTLSAFCTELTAIRQEDVDGAPAFPEAFDAHQAWLASQGLLESTFAFVTCGEWDLRSMLPRQCATSGLVIPPAYRRWINVKTIFQRTLQKKPGGMPSMLSALGLELEGRHHRGIDDCRNIARIVLALHERGASFDITTRLSASQMPGLPITLRLGDHVEHVVLRKRVLSTLRGLASGLFRAKIVRFETSEGVELRDDDALLDLRPGDEVRARR